VCGWGGVCVVGVCGGGVCENITNDLGSV